ncbi:MAG: hypothetical protein V4527_14995 [Pseudomonadota bacterium]
MPLTPTQRKLQIEAETIAILTRVDLESIEDLPAQYRLVALRIAINHMVIAEVVSRYTLLDELFSDLIARYFFKQPKKPIHFGKLWRTKKFRIFNHQVLDEMFLLKKASIIHSVKPLPAEVMSFVQRLNAIRNAFAHSFFPENRRENFKTKKVLYGGLDIRTSAGIEKLLDDFQAVWMLVVRRAYPKWRE